MLLGGASSGFFIYHKSIVWPPRLDSLFFLLPYVSSHMLGSDYLEFQPSWFETLALYTIPILHSMQTVVADGRPEEKETLVEMLDSWYQGINSDGLSDDTTHFLPFCTSLMNTAQDSSACVQAAKRAYKIIVENVVLCNRMEIVRAAYRGLDRMGAFWCFRQDLSVDELYEWLLLDHQIHSSTDLEAMLRAPQQLRTKTQTRT